MATSGYALTDSVTGNIQSVDAPSLQEAFAVGQAITIANTENRTLLITNNDDTNDPVTTKIDANSNGTGLLIDSDEGVCLDLNHIDTTTNKTLNISRTGSNVSDIDALYITSQNTGGGSSNSIFVDGGKTILDVSDAEAFLVRKNGDTGDVFSIDTTNSQINITAPATTSCVIVTADTLTTGQASIQVFSGSNALSSGRGLWAEHLATAITADFTGSWAQIDTDRTLTAASTRSDAGQSLLISKAITVNNAGGTFTDNGSALSISVSGTQTAGTLNNNIKALDISMIGTTSSAARVAYFSGADMELVDGVDMILGTSTGTKIGTATTQKLGFFNTTPVVQQTNVTNPTGGVVIDAEARTAIDAILSRIETLGLFAA